MPLAVSATTLSGRRTLRSTKDRTWVAKSSSTSPVVTVPALSPGTTTRAAATIALISTSPVSSPTGRAPDRHSLIPLYLAGLCDAVNMAPGASNRPDAK